MDGHCIYIFVILCGVQANFIRRIILANEPRLFRQMLKRVIKGVNGLQVVGEVARSDDLVRILEHTDVQWVIVTLPFNGKMPQVAKGLLLKHPTLSILAVASDGRNSVIESIESHEEIFHNLSLDELIAILRGQRGKPRYEMEGVMDETTLANNWKELKSKVKGRWHSLSDEDIRNIDGSREVLVSMLQEKYYYSKEKAEEEVNHFLKEFAPAL